MITLGPIGLASAHPYTSTNWIPQAYRSTGGWGTRDSITARVAEYHAAGADQVVLRILGVDDLTSARAQLAEALIG
jgi:hypothetical protein